MISGPEAESHRAGREERQVFGKIKAASPYNCKVACSSL